MQSVCITGTNRGIGLEFAKQYAKAGWQVYARCRNPDAAKNLHSLNKEYPNLTILLLDVADETSITKFAASLKDKPIDLFIMRKIFENHMGKSLKHQDPMFINYKGDVLPW